MKNLKVKIVLINELAILPTYGTEGSGAMDITATSKFYDEYGNTCYGTGLRLEAPEGYQGIAMPRSSISKTDLMMANSVALLDNDFRGETIIKFKNKTMPNIAPHVQLNLVEGVITLTNEYEVGEKIAQLMFLPVPVIEWEEVKELSITGRGDGAFGSTDKKADEVEAPADVQEEEKINEEVEGVKEAEKPAPEQKEEEAKQAPKVVEGKTKSTRPKK